MELSLAQVEHVADLARLDLDDQEKALFRGQLSAILDHVASLQRLHTDAIPATATILPLENVMRDDLVEPSMAQADALGNAPLAEENCFRVPAVLESDG